MQYHLVLSFLDCHVVLPEEIMNPVMVPQGYYKLKAVLK